MRRVRSGAYADLVVPSGDTFKVPVRPSCLDEDGYVTENNSNENHPRAAPLGQEVKQRTIDVLCESFAQDEIDVEEFEQRVELVHQAETLEQLRTILADLPTSALPVKSNSLPQTAIAPHPLPTVELAPRPTISPERIQENSVMVGIMGGGGRTGAWIPARRNWVVGVMGGHALDFREAHRGPGVTEVNVFAVMGGVEILVPPDVRVECSGIGIMGGFDVKHSVTSTTDPDAPVIRVNGVAIMGGASVAVRYPGETARDARLRLKARKKALRLIAKGK